MNVYANGVKLLIELIQEVKPICKKEVRYISVCTKKVRYISIFGFIQKSFLIGKLATWCGMSYFSLYLYTKNYSLIRTF